MIIPHNKRQRRRRRKQKKTEGKNHKRGRERIDEE
jgi:hypothetical protein